MRRSILIFVILTFSLIQVEAQIQSGLDSEGLQLLSSYYSEKEISEIKKIVCFIDSIVLSENFNSNLDSAYHYFLDKLCKEGYETDEMLIIDPDLNKKFLSSLDSSVVYDIWEKCEVLSVQTWDTIIHNPPDWPCLEFNINGRYYEIIHELGKDYEYFKRLPGYIDDCACISASIIMPLICGNESFDFNDFNIRLWTSIVLLCLEEPVEKKLDRYLEKMV